MITTELRKKMKAVAKVLNDLADFLENEEFRWVLRNLKTKHPIVVEVLTPFSPPKEHLDIVAKYRGQVAYVKSSSGEVTVAIVVERGRLNPTAAAGPRTTAQEERMTNVYTHFQIRNNRHFDDEGNLLPESELLEECQVTSEIFSQMQSRLLSWAEGCCSPQDWDDNTMVDPDGTITITNPNYPLIYAVAKPEGQP